MALKPNRNIRHDSIGFYCNEVAERGRAMVYDASTSGLGGLDEAGALVKMPTGSVSLTAVAGILMNDVVDVDLSRYRLNEHQDEVQKNSKVRLAKVGFVTTNCIVAGVNPVAGSGCYATTSGEMDMTNRGEHMRVGRWDS